MKRIIVSLSFIAIAISFCSILYSCNSSKSQKESKETFTVGDYAFFKDNCVGVVDKDDWDDVLKLVKADDMSSLSILVATGKATTFAAGKQIKVIKTGYDLTQIKDIFASDLLYFVPTNMLTHEDVYGIFQFE